LGFFFFFFFFGNISGAFVVVQNGRNSPRIHYVSTYNLVYTPHGESDGETILPRARSQPAGSPCKKLLTTKVTHILVDPDKLVRLDSLKIIHITPYKNFTIVHGSNSGRRWVQPAIFDP